jgi:hypothetical protein
VDLPVLPHDSVTGGKFNPPNKLRNSCKSICAKQAGDCREPSLAAARLTWKSPHAYGFSIGGLFRDLLGIAASIKTGTFD